MTHPYAIELSDHNHRLSILDIYTLMTTTHCQAMHIQSDRQVMHITKEYGKSRQSPACVTKLHHIYLSTNLSDMHQASNKALRTFQGHIATDINNTLRMDRLSLLSKDNNSELL